MNFNRIKYSAFILVTIFFAVIVLFQNTAGASVDEADAYREQGRYEEAIEEYKKHEDFYNYYLLKNLNNKSLYLEYSRLLADIMLRIAETYNDWEKDRNMKEYCNKIIFLSKKIGDDEVVNPIRVRAEELLRGAVPPTKRDTEDKVEEIEEEPDWVEELNEEDYLKLELEDAYSLPDDSSLTEKELDDTLDDIENSLSEYNEKEPEEPEEPEEPLEITDPFVNDTRLSTIQSLNPKDGPHASQIHKDKKFGNNFVVLHLTRFGLDLSSKLGKPSFVSISDGDNTITSDDTGVSVEFLNTETTRLYLAINLTKGYSISELSELHTALANMILSIPPGTSIFLTYSGSDGTVNNIELNSDNLFDTINLIASKSRTSTNDLIEKTYEVIEYHDDIEIYPRFMLVIHDEESVNARLSNKANELSVPIHIYTVGEDGMSERGEISLKRLTENTVGTYASGNLTDLIEYIYTFSLYLVQSTFVVKWPYNTVSDSRELDISIRFDYLNESYSITFTTSLIP